MSALGWGFIGASIWARTRMIPAVQATTGADAIAVGSRSAQRARALADECDVRRAYGSVEELLADGDVDVVYISSRNDLHAHQAIAAADAGKHVLCEKPLAASLQDAERVREACERNGVVLSVNHHLRGAATIQALRRLIAEGAVGDPVAVRIAHLTSLPAQMRTWRLEESGGGGGVAMDLTVHDADTLRFVLDDEIVEVFAQASSGQLGQGRVEDSIMGVMRTRRGVMIGFTDSFVLPHPGTSLEVHGTAGSILARDVLLADPVGEVWLARDGRLEEVPIRDRRPLYEQAVERMCEAVRGERPPLCSGEDGIRSLAVALAARESAHSGRPTSPPGVRD